MVARPWRGQGRRRRLGRRPPSQEGGHGRVLDVRRWIVAPGGRRHVAGRRLRVGRLLIAGVRFAPTNAAPTLARSGRRAGWSAPRVRQMLRACCVSAGSSRCSGMRRVRIGIELGRACRCCQRLGIRPGAGVGVRRAAAVASAASGSSGASVGRCSSIGGVLARWMARPLQRLRRPQQDRHGRRAGRGGRAGAPTGQAAARRPNPKTGHDGKVGERRRPPGARSSAAPASARRNSGGDSRVALLAGRGRFSRATKGRPSGRRADYRRPTSEAILRGC